MMHDCACFLRYFHASLFITALDFKHRLRKSGDIEHVFKKGQKKDSFYFYIKFLPNDLDIVRFGIIVSIKLFKKAVVRNKIKRRISEICRKNLKSIKNGYDIIFIAKPAILTADNIKLTNDFFKVLKRANLLN